MRYGRTEYRLSWATVPDKMSARLCGLVFSPRLARSHTVGSQPLEAIS